MNIFPHLENTFKVVFFSDFVKASSFKLCVIIMLRGLEEDLYGIIPHVPQQPYWSRD